MSHSPIVDPNPAVAPVPDDPEPSYLGPATVIELAGSEVVAELETEARDRVQVALALTFPYEPAPGDSLLVLGRSGRHWAVGVIAGGRPATLEFQGDATIHAVGGRLTLASDRAVHLEAPRVTVRAGVLRTIAASVVEKTDTLRRWVRGLLAVRAGSSRRLIDGEDSTRCQNSTTLAKDTIRIDADQLHLGH